MHDRDLNSTRRSRRRFLGQALATGTLLGAPRVLFPRSPAEGGKYRTALIGSGWWGTNILREAVRSERCRIVALCDADRRQVAACRAELAKMTTDAPKEYRDFRDMLREEKPEICIVASPDHWHPLQTIAAVQAGAHVYVEKPISHTIREGRAMVNAARRAGRVVQVGTHRRISPHNVSGRDFIRSGKLGKVAMVRSFVHSGGGPERPVKNTAPPDEIDWDLWCGPAPRRHYCENLPGGWGSAIHPKGFRNYLDYANGTLGDWGIHWLDQILWILDETSPKTVFSHGGRPVKGPPVYTETEQTTDAPDHQVVVYEFDGFTATWEHRKFAGNGAEKTDPRSAVGCYFYGTEGTLHMGWRDGWTFYPRDARKAVIHEEPKLNLPDEQNIRELWADFLQAIASGGRPVCDVEAIHHSTAMALLGMLSYKLGRSVEWDGERELCVGDAAANDLLRRDYRGPWVYPEA